MGLYIYIRTHNINSMQIYTYTQKFSHPRLQNTQQTTLATIRTIGQTKVGKHLSVIITLVVLRGSGHRIIGHASALYL